MKQENGLYESIDIVPGRVPIDVVINNDFFIVFTLSEPIFLNDGLFEEHWPIHICQYIPDENHRLYGWNTQGFKGWDRPLTVNTIPSEFIIASQDTSIYYKGVGKNKQQEKTIRECIGYDYSYDVSTGAFAITKIEDTIIATGRERCLFIRKGPNEWDMVKPTEESIELCEEDEHDRNEWEAFYAIDGFSLDDIYLGGGNRDIWHYNHTTGEWKPMFFDDENNFMVQTICCADDGKVYVGGRDGMLAIGRDDEWEFVRLDHGRHIEKIVSFNGKIYIGTEAHTYVLNEEHQSDIYDFDGELNFTGGAVMDAAYGMLVVANKNGKIALHRNGKWQAVHGIDD